MCEKWSSIIILAEAHHRYSSGKVEISHRKQMANPGPQAESCSRIIHQSRSLSLNTVNSRPRRRRHNHPFVCAEEMHRNTGTFEAETARDYTINLPESESITQPHWPGTWVLPSQQQSLLLFLKGQPQVLGVAQILIGLIILCLGVTISPFPLYDYDSQFCITTELRYHLWGPFSFFISGALSIAAGRKVTKGLIQGSLGMNTVSATVAGIGIIVIIFEEIIMYDTVMWKFSYAVAFIGMLTGLLLLSLAEGCIALALSIFVCRAACSINKVVVFLPNNDNSPSPDHLYDEVAFQ
ncbi:membrane-spanning 4-domains subfamily A member 4A-like [Neofelis nebulosa]|uniref:membrane-spanning 4-domains subfamily A member 4A-like n=1 Tax=Neofelis nebulosa TaxID=61452 RepID=UPI00272C5A2B|nr:membrane-spanning 4-domains subfamily A member 4A-like [Neofelis nebulosa]